LLTLAALTACNEKISPELQNANATGTTGGGGGGGSTGTTGGGGSGSGTNPPFYFRLVDNSASMLNYRLHKTGPGNFNQACQITPATQFSNNAYRADQATYDITCFLEAEELALFYNGFSLGVEASPNSCKYVSYQPYSYYNRQPGSSTGTFRATRCDAALADNPSVLTANAPAAPSCGRMRQVTTPALLEFEVASDQDLCRFNYQDGNEEQCDEGTIVINEYSYTYNLGPDNLPNTADDIFTPGPIASRTVRCGGRASNCIAGPIKDTVLTGTSGSIIYQGSAGAFSTTLDYPSIFAQQIVISGGYTTLPLANYRRDLANPNIEYGASTKPLTNGYRSAFGDPIFGKIFDPNLMTFYALGRRMDNTELFQPLSATPTDGSLVVIDNQRVRAFASEPFVGYGQGRRTNPFYSFACLDNAYDIKARIRLMVRDWDRITIDTDILERLSDVDLLPPLARQDVPDTEEIPGDPTPYNNFNDLADWDDILAMVRDDNGLPYDPSVTVWRPAAGYFSPSNFPNAVKDE
jgi:hypothetical protein